jgi:soluble cytochrome b562
MSVAGISSSSFFNLTSPALQSKIQQSRQEFQELGQDLQSGNLSAAQADFATLQQLNPQAQSTTSAQGTSPIAQEFAQLSKDLQSGNLSAAQQDYNTLQQDVQTRASGTHPHHHHHGGGGGGSSAISQLLDQLGQSLQSGNLTAAQQAYSTLQQDFLAQSNGVLSNQASPQAGTSTFTASA